MKLNICWMYHDLMDLYGDKGNIQVLKTRCLERGIECNVDFCDIGEIRDLSEYDLLFIGRLTEQKDPERFIELVEDIKKTKKDIQAVMIGIGELEEKCQDLINKKDLKNNITMLGFLENPFSIMKNCKACFMPSKWEGFGLTAIETMVLGIPVFCSGVGGLGEIFKNNKEFICKTNEDYVNKYFEFESKNLSKKVAEISDTYCNKHAYLKQLTDLYGLEVK